MNHNNPNGQKFSQKIFLWHVDFDLPLIFETEGYERDEHKTRELSSLFQVNQLSVEHRFFGESTLEPKQWEYLNIWQAAMDHHRIVSVFKEIYKENWISSGASKGGNTACFHRRFFPDDVAGTVAYVSPFLKEERDQRFLDYYESTAGEGCFEKIRNYQRMMLMNQYNFELLFDSYIDEINEQYGTDFQFSLNFSDIIYSSIREDYMFEFWSSEFLTCENIPGEMASVEELFQHYVDVFNIFLFFSDYGVRFWTPWYYQSLTELGNYTYITDHLTDLERAFNPLVSFPGTIAFDPSKMEDIIDWIETEAEEMIFIYGADDPWTVAAIEGKNPNVIRIVNPGTKHGTRISNLSSEDELVVMNKLEKWLDL